MGTPLFSVPVLEMLLEETKVVGVVTQPDRAVGRHQEIKISPIKEVALRHDVKILQPENIKEDYDEILDLKPDIIITCAYGQILPQKLLDAPRLGCVNVHASLLPKLRGGAPLHHCLIDGYSKTGITIMYMVDQMDAGDIISQQETEITMEDTVQTIHDRLSLMAPKLLKLTLPMIVDGKVVPIKQNEEEATYAPTITADDEVINYSKSMKQIYNQIRGLCPFPGSFTYLDGKRMKVFGARMGDKVDSTKINGEIIAVYDDGIGVKVENGEIIFTDIQLAGKKRMSVKDYLNGLSDRTLLIGNIMDQTNVKKAYESRSIIEE